MTATPKIIFFDLDETLIENVKPIQQVFSETLVHFSHDVEALDQRRFLNAFRESAPLLWNSMFDHEQTPEQQLIRCFELALIKALSASPQTIDTHSLAGQVYAHFLQRTSQNIRLQTGAIDTLHKLSDLGLLTGIITNGIEQVQLNKIHTLELHTHVNHVIVSAQAGAHKPSAQVFEYALEQAGVDASHAWQIGDHAHNDVAGAIRVGMNGVFYNPHEHNIDDAFAELTERPKNTIAQLSDVISLVESE